MAVHPILKPVVTHKRMISLLCASAVFHSVLITYMVSEKYEGTALVVIRPQEMVRFTSNPQTKELLNFPVSFNIPLKAASQTYTEVITSHAIAENLVRTLRLDRETEEPTGWKRLKKEVKGFLLDVWTYLKYGRVERVSPFDRAVEEVQKSLSATPTKDTYVFEIRCKARDKKLAADIANTAAEELLAYNRESTRQEAQGFRELLESRLKESALAVVENRRSLQKYKEKYDIVLLDEELTTKIKYASEARSSLNATQRDIAATLSEIAEIRKLSANQSSYQKSSYTVKDNPLVNELKSELTKLEIDFSGRSKTLTPTHPELTALQAKIDLAKSKLRDEVSRILSDETSSLNVVHQNLAADLVAAETKLEGLRAKEQKLIQLVSAQIRELERSPSLQSQVAQMELELGVKEDTYKLIKGEFEEARVREAESLSELKVVSPAVVPVYPSQPIKIYYAGVSLVMALTTGLGSALFFDNFRLSPEQPNA